MAKFSLNKILSGYFIYVLYLMSRIVICISIIYLYLPGIYLSCSTDADYEVKRKFAGFSLGFVKMVKQLSLQ